MCIRDSACPRRDGQAELTCVASYVPTIELAKSHACLIDIDVSQLKRPDLIHDTLDRLSIRCLLWKLSNSFLGCSIYRPLAGSWTTFPQTHNRLGWGWLPSVPIWLEISSVHIGLIWCSYAPVTGSSRGTYRFLRLLYIGSVAWLMDSGGK